MVTGIQRLQSFIAYLRSNKLMEQGEIISAVKQMQGLDRRIGQLAMLRGFLTPEQVSAIMIAQTRINKKFAELGIELGFLNGTQADEIVRLQQDEMFSFSQAAVMARVRRLPEMVGHIRSFLASNPAPVDEKDKKTEKPAGRLVVSIREILLKIKGVAPLPGVVTKVVQMLDDPKVAMESVSKIIMMDPGLVTTLLRIVNSAFYGLRSQAKTVTQALVVLGTKKIKELVLVAGIMQKFKDIRPEDASAFWDRSIAAAQWSKTLGAQQKLGDVDLLFINGFIHNVGELVILQHFPAEYQQIRKLRDSGVDGLAAERQVLGGTHADISAFLFEIWQFPAFMIQSAMVHHYPLGQIQQMSSVKRESAIVHLAASIIDLDPEMDPYEFMTRLDGIVRGYSSFLSLDDLVIEDMAVDVRTAVGELKKMFKFS